MATNNAKNKSKNSPKTDEAAPDYTTLNFEEAYSRLNQTAARLEQGGLPLEESLALYEEGVVLAHLCEELLAKAELRITQLTTTPNPASPKTKTYTFTTPDDTDEDNSEDDDWNDQDLQEAINDLQV